LSILLELIKLTQKDLCFLFRNEQVEKEDKALKEKLDIKGWKYLFRSK